MQNLIFEKAVRRKAKAKIALMGTAGSGKTYGALKLARGLCGKDGKIAVLDTESNSADLYSNLTEYDTCAISNYSVEVYIAAIKQCEASGYDCLIIDSLSPAWDALLDDLERIKKTATNSFTAWKTLTPRYNELIQVILQAKMHIIATMRNKTEYAMEQNDKGKSVPKKIGLAPVMRDGIEYEFTIVFNIDCDSHYATTTKDRTSLFASDPIPFLITEDTGELISDWLNSGEEERTPEDYAKLICERLDGMDSKDALNYRMTKFGGLYDKIAHDFDLVEKVKKVYTEKTKPIKQSESTNLLDEINDSIPDFPR